MRYRGLDEYEIMKRKHELGNDSESVHEWKKTKTKRKYELRNDGEPVHEWKEKIMERNVKDWVEEVENQSSIKSKRQRMIVEQKGM